jgi:hypothetical protein
MEITTSEGVAAVRDEEVAAERKSMYGYAQTSFATSRRMR